MKSIKCPQCGLTNWETSEWCKRCKNILKSNEHLNGSTFTNSQTGSQNSDTYNSQTNYGRTSPQDANGFVATSLRSCQRNIIVVCILVITALIGGLIVNTRYFYNAVFGPFPTSRDQLFSKKIHQDSFKNYVTIGSNEVYDTGAEYVETSKKYRSETVKHKYLALSVGDSLLLAKVDPNSNIQDGAIDVTVSGALSDISAEEHEKVLGPIFRSNPNLHSEFMPFMIDARSNFSTTAYISILVGITLMIIAVWILRSAWGNYGNIEVSSSLKTLSAHGTPREMAAVIDDELSKNHEKVGSIYISPSWVIKKGLFSLNIHHVDDIVWVYKKTTKHSVNFIPTGKTHEVMLHTNQGKSISLSGNGEKNIDTIIDIIYARIPWVVAGYSDDLMQHWKADEKDFIKAVAERKASLVNDSNPQAV